MFLFGLIALLQTAFLPGFLLLKLLRLSDGLLKTLILSFALSLVLNYLIVFFLVVVGAYGPPAMYGLLGLELLGLGYLLWFHRGKPEMAALQSDLQRAEDLVRSLGSYAPFSRLVVAAAVLLGVWMIASYAVEVCFKEIGTIFVQWDPVVTWNRWAVSWAENRLPSTTFHYPQLLPANWSVSYVLMGDSRIQFFAKGLMSLFPLWILLAQADLALRLRRPIYFLAVAITGQAMRSMTPLAISSGHADVPVAFMGFAACYVLLVGREVPSLRQLKKHLLVGAVVAGGCLLTKQSGLLVALLFPVLAYLLVFRSLPPQLAPKGWRWLAYSSGLILILVLPWYVYKEVQIYLSLDVSETSFILFDTVPVESSTHEGRSCLERMLFGIALLRDRFTAPVFFGIVPVTLLAALADKTWRWFVALIVLPMFVIWGLFFSYDCRNLLPAIPFAATAVAVGLERLACLVTATAGLRRIVVAGVLLLLLPAAWIAGKHFNAEALLKRQETLQRSICPSELNEFLYKYHQSPGFKGNILGNNGYLHALPVIRDIYRYHPMEDRASVETRIARGDVRYILVTDYAHLKDFLDEAVSAGRLKLIDSCVDHQLLEIVSPTDEVGDRHPGVQARPFAGRSGD